MCIIAVYNSKEQINRARLDYMAAKNSDGIGIAAAYKTGVAFIKGLTSAKSAARVMERAFSLGAHTVVFHARIATSGGVSAEKCHPFILSAKPADLNAVKGTAPAVVFHNGIVPIRHEKDESDTQAYIRKILAPNAAKIARGTFDEVIELSIQGSRLCILTPSGAKLYGEEWTADDGGVIYSNTGYKPYTPPAFRWRAWDEYDARTRYGEWSDNTASEWTRDYSRRTRAAERRGAWKRK